MAAELTENQLLLINNLIYLEDVAIHLGEDITVEEIIDNLLANNGKGLDESRDLRKIGTDEEYPACISRERWIEILEAIRDDKELCNLIITKPVDFQSDGHIEVDGKKVECKAGMRAACFVDKTTNSATVVFRGTGSTAEWHDNGEGGALIDINNPKNMTILKNKTLRNTKRQFGQEISFLARKIMKAKESFIVGTTRNHNAMHISSF